MKLALGTVQFGLDYGIANQAGRVPLEQARQMIVVARHLGFDTLDTAIAYGDSEGRLGQIGISGWKVISKLPGLPAEETDVAAWVEAQVRGSLDRLGVSRLQGLLLHRPLDLRSAAGPALYRALVSLRERGVVGKIGISVYGPEELDDLCGDFDFDLIQAPLNILDRRLADSGWLARLAGKGTEVHVRSAFLQGLLLMASSARPAPFGRWQSLWHAWDGWLADTGLTPLAACLRYATSMAEVSRVVVGADNPAQLAEIAASCDGPLPALPPSLQCADPDLLVPSNWARLGQQ